MVIVGAILVFYLQRRTEKLRQHFSLEYDRAVAEGGDRRHAEARLEERTERVKKLHLRPLTAEDRARFTEQWDRVQAHFVDTPAGAVAEADQLNGDLMAACGSTEDLRRAMIHHRALFEDLVSESKETTAVERKLVAAADGAVYNGETVRARRS